MQIHKVQVFDPLYHPGKSTPLPARMEILVSGVDLHAPTETYSEDGWTIAKYGDFFYLFWHEGDLGEKSVPDEEYNEETVVFHEGWVNVMGPVPEPLFPVTVTNQGEPWRVMYVPVQHASRWLDEFVPGIAAGKWALRANTELAMEGQIVFDLFIQPARGRNLRAEHARLTR